MTYEMHVAGLVRHLPICKLSDNLSIGAFVIFGDVELTCACARALLEKAPDFDYMVAPEAKAIPLIYEMARQSGRNEYFLVRKNKKAYMNGVFEVEDKSITTEGTPEIIYGRRRRQENEGKTNPYSGRRYFHGRISCRCGKSCEPGRRHCGRTYGNPGRRRRRKARRHNISGGASAF